MPPARRQTTSGATLVARRVSKSRDRATILDEVELVVTPYERVGVIGPNGVGKTTLLRILAGLDRPDSGEVVVMPRRATVGYLGQEPETRPGETLRSLLGRKTGVDEAEQDLASAAEALAGAGAGACAGPGARQSEPGAGRSGPGAGRSEPGARQSAPSEAYSDALETYLTLGGPDFDARIGETLDEVGLPQALLGVPISDLSGGQASKAALCALLLSRFDLLLLDEPTNNLDFEGLRRLESFLEERSGAVVVVSHDRALLSRVVTSVLEIDESTHRGALHAGGWEAYLESRAIARRHAEERYAAYVSERDRLSAREREQRQWAVTGVAREKRKPRDNDKAQRGFRLNRTEKQASKVRQTEHALERLEKVPKPFEPWRLELVLPSARRSGELVGTLEGAVVRRGEWALGPVDLDVRFGDRLAVLGPNGSGKTTLLLALLGRLPLESGRQRLGPSVVVGELGQARGGLSPEGEHGQSGGGSLLQGFLRATGQTTPEARSLLAKFGLGAGDVERDPGSLSPGERTRAELALLMARGTNCLVLDEPTNHLDLPAIEQLERALEAWTGTLLLVTHDRRFLQSVRLTSRVELRDGRLERRSN